MAPKDSQRYELVSFNGRVLPPWRSDNPDTDRLVFDEWILPFSGIGMAFPLTIAFRHVYQGRESVPSDDLSFINSVDSIVAPEVADTIELISSEGPEFTVAIRISSFLNVTDFLRAFIRGEYTNTRFAVQLCNMAEGDDENAPSGFVAMIVCNDLMELRRSLGLYWNVRGGTSVFLVKQADMDAFLSPANMAARFTQFKRLVDLSILCVLQYDHGGIPAIITQDRYWGERVRSLTEYR